jgi:hypothetical protein
MSKSQIPVDHTAARALYDAFVALGRDEPQQSASSTAPRSRRARRAAVLVPIVLLSLATAAGAARVLLDDGPAVKGEPQVPRVLRPAQHDADLAATRTSDPDGILPWGVRLYPSAAGGRCAIVGQVKGSMLGVLRGRRYSPLAPNAPGTCARPGAHVLIAQQKSNTGSGRRDVLFGFADRSILAIAIVDGPSRREVPIAVDGSFVAVSGAAFHGTLVIATKTGDIRRRLRP